MGSARAAGEKDGTQDQILLKLWVQEWVSREQLRGMPDWLLSPSSSPPLSVICVHVSWQTVFGFALEPVELKANNWKSTKDYTMKTHFPPSTIQLASGSNCGDGCLGYSTLSSPYIHTHSCISSCKREHATQTVLPLAFKCIFFFLTYLHIQKALSLFYSCSFHCNLFGQIPISSHFAYIWLHL